MTMLEKDQKLKYSDDNKNISHSDSTKGLYILKEFSINESYNAKIVKIITQHKPHSLTGTFIKLILNKNIENRKVTLWFLENAASFLLSFFLKKY